MYETPFKRVQYCFVQLTRLRIVFVYIKYDLSGNVVYIATFWRLKARLQILLRF